jgi:hypothetical protein
MTVANWQIFADIQPSPSPRDRSSASGSILQRKTKFVQPLAPTFLNKVIVSLHFAKKISLFMLQFYRKFKYSLKICKYFRYIL